MGSTFGIIGSGWRSEFFLRIARSAPDRFRVTGVVTRSAERGDAITAAWGVPTFRSAADLVRAEAPDFVIASVPWAVMPDAIRELVGLGGRCSPRPRPRRTCRGCGRCGTTSAAAASSRSPSSTC